MNEGHFIGLHDKTTCGGTVLDGHSGINMYGILHAREGDRVTCGEDGETYRIIGGISYMISHGKAMAGTLDSLSGCPCRARLIPSVFTATYQSANAAPPTARVAVQPLSNAATSQPAAPRHSAFTPSTPPVPPVFTRMEPQEPGFYVVPNSMTRQALEATLFTTPDAAVMRKFRALNPEQSDFKAGSLIVLSDPHNTSCTYQEAQLMQAAQQVRAALDPLTPSEAEFMHRHAAEIASFTGETSTWLGVSAVIMEKHLASLRDTLQAMERLHQDTYRQHGHLRSPQFFADRQRLLAQLDAHLLNSTRLRGYTTLGDHPKLKTALGISTRSLVHRWDKAGAPGQIPGYTTHVEATSRAAKYMQAGGYIGIGIGGVSSLLNIQEVCNGGSEDACKKIKFTEGGKFVGSTVGGIVGGVGAPLISGSICLALGVTTGIGSVICSAAIVGTTAWVGAEIGSLGGEGVGEVFYEKTLP
ncbi:PAAR domain-containing protein [Pseudomonas vancouverensis]|uniref:PAAR domain-containing protein n=1 Tax=Pseudomonas vancouverensis TaxID=95300 RepID=A0A4R4K082_PSEVA|nr:PAAR domain-containing protein [Pseudomonas vancouverensis]KAB0491097.1 PAAR domain-containing protein [Pseudomonas vancouverensis]TDB59691.1 PAAR domain-containing protein [Pseudomonas vancouverensis]